MSLVEHRAGLSISPILPLIMCSTLMEPIVCHPGPRTLLNFTPVLQRRRCNQSVERLRFDLKDDLAEEFAPSPRSPQASPLGRRCGFGRLCTVRVTNSPWRTED